MPDPLKYFRIEAREIIEQLQAGLLELERSGAHPERTQSLLRLAHTLKGAARVVKQLEIAQLSHRFEDLLVPLRDVTAQVAPAQVEGLLGVLDSIAGLVAKLTSTAPGSVPPAAQAEPTVAVATPASVTFEEAPRVQAAPLEHVETLMEGVSELGFQLGNVRRAAPELGRSQRLAEELHERLAARRLVDLSPANAASLRALASELALRLEKLEREMSTGIERATRELGQVRDRVDQLRLVAVGSIFGALERTTRDSAVSLGKQASFEARGGDVRLDADVLTAVQRALVQAVRNAVAHGIESTSERSKLGKPVQGRVTLEVQRRGKQISFLCRDDGKGVDLGRVRQEAERLGRTGRGAGDGELITQLLRGGISTSAQVTEVSGRGVGMDLIREAIGGVGGEVTLTSEPGAGTSVVLRVPATLSALDGLLVSAGGEPYALPLASVVRSLRIHASELTLTADGASLLFEQRALPFVPLAWLMQRGAARDDQRAAWSVLVVESDGERLALGVDRLLGSESLVARSLPSSAQLDATVAGVTLDTEGNPRLLLDPEALLNSARSLPRRTPSVRPSRRAILVIDDSLTTRMLEQSILESAGYEVELATSGEQGLEKARQRRFDMLLVDVEMPGMDGFTFVEQVRADPRLEKTPTMLVTSRVSPEDLARGKAVGADGHIAKGEFDQVDFLERIDRLTR